MERGSTVRLSRLLSFPALYRRPPAFVLGTGTQYNVGFHEPPSTIRALQEALGAVDP